MRILFLILLLCVVADVEATAQHTTTSKSATPNKSAARPPAAATLTPGSAPTLASLKTDTLNYGDDVKRIYAGDFEHVTFKPDSTEFGLMVGGYMGEYSESCDRYLPKDKVEIMRQECATEQVTRNGYGTEVSRSCISWRTVGTGLYADPQVYSLQKRLDAGMAAGMMDSMFKGMSQRGGDPAGGMKQMTDVAVYVKQDMSHFVDDNGCASPATMRFQANMLHYGRGEQPIRMAGAAEAMASSATSLAKGQDYKKLVDDLIAAESRAWMMNRYVQGSVQVSAVQRDGGGEPREIDAGYGFQMMGNPGAGRVRVAFENGTPACLYFSDFPTTCRAPSPGVLSAYKRNQYADANAANYPESAPAAVRQRPTQR
jgi:hypothetical protein